jgi:hypothetical protein
MAEAPENDAATEAPPPEYRCDFCGTPEHDVIVLSFPKQKGKDTGPLICDSCVEACQANVNNIARQKLHNERQEAVLQAEVARRLAEKMPSPIEAEAAANEAMHTQGAVEGAPV